LKKKSTCLWIEKKKGQNLPWDWKEVKSWLRPDYSDDDIDVFVHKELKDLNRSAGILTFPGAYRNHNNKYGVFQFGSKWQFNYGQFMNYFAICLLKDRCTELCIGGQNLCIQRGKLLYAQMAQEHVPKKDRGKEVSQVC
jgi:hypothetical protein